MNATINDFFQKHNIDANKLASQKDSHIHSTAEIDELVANFGIDGQSYTGNISVADIIGYEACGVQSSNLLYDLVEFFDRNGDGYHRRSCGLLDIPVDSIMQTLERSFQVEPISVRYIHGNSNMIYTNGLHRYTVLRTHFLNESYGLDKESEAYQVLKQKYTFAARIIPVDLIKTYSNFLLSTHPNLKFKVSKEYDENWQPTNNIEVTFNNGEKRLLNDEQLLMLTREVILAVSDDLYTIERLERAQENYEEFAEYIDTYIPELSIKKKNETIGGAKL